MNYSLSIGINLDNRKLTLSIPDNTEISELKYIAKTENNYIAEENNKAYFHYVKNGEEVSEIFYEQGTTNLQEIILPDNFGTIIDVDESSVLYPYITRSSHEKTYVISEDFAKKESLSKDEIKTEVEENVRSYGMPVNSVIKYDGDDIPNGFEEIEGGSSLEAELGDDYILFSNGYLITRLAVTKTLNTGDVFINIPLPKEYKVDSMNVQVTQTNWGNGFANLHLGVYQKNTNSITLITYNTSATGDLKLDVYITGFAL